MEVGGAIITTQYSTLYVVLHIVAESGGPACCQFNSLRHVPGSMVV